MWNSILKQSRSSVYAGSEVVAEVTTYETEGSSFWSEVAGSEKAIFKRKEPPDIHCGGHRFSIT